MRFKGHSPLKITLKIISNITLEINLGFYELKPISFYIRYAWKSRSYMIMYKRETCDENLKPFPIKYGYCTTTNKSMGKCESQQQLMLYRNYYKKKITLRTSIITSTFNHLITISFSFTLWLVWFSLWEDCVFWVDSSII